MNKLKLLALAASNLLFFSTALLAQNEESSKSVYNHEETFNPIFYTNAGNEFRNADGRPGPKYWQNRANYQIEARLDTLNHRVTGTCQIQYTNNSPQNLDYLWLQVEQNIFKKGSRGDATSSYEGGRFANASYTNGDEIKSVSLIESQKEIPVDYIITDTRMQIRLKSPLQSGKTITLKINYSFQVPEYGTDRMGRELKKDGWIYEIAQWYPRMCVYDDLAGWNTIPYLGASEFYLEYGNFDYKITAPAGLLLVGSGKLVNPEQTLSLKLLKKYLKAQQSDTTYPIRTEKDIEDGPYATTVAAKPEVTWHFICENARDVAWAASRSFIWDGARINLPEGRKSFAQSVYPIESTGADGWDSSTRFVKSSIELYSNKWKSFTYPSATNVAGPVNGMEYPGIVFCGENSKGSVLWNVENHEFGHNWFPMLVGSNERKYAWMDEGFNTFINGIDTKEFKNGAYLDKMNLDIMAHYLFRDDICSIMTTPDVMPSDDLGMLAYYKPALGLDILREQILGEKRFDYAFKNYINNWTYKHPSPWDFFRSIENAAGEDLSWFWREWFLNNWKLDQSIKGVQYLDADSGKVALITIENKQKIALPVTLAISLENGSTDTLKLPVEIWQRGGSWTFKYKCPVAISGIQIDPNHDLPDYDRSNNVWSAKPQQKIPAGLKADDVIKDYIKSVGGVDAISAIKSLEMNLECQSQGVSIKMNKTFVSPDKSYTEVTVPSMDMIPLKIIINGDKIKLLQMNKEVPLNEQMKKIIVSQHAIIPELNFSQDSVTLELNPFIQDINGKKAYEVKAKFNDLGLEMICYYDIQNGLKLKMDTKINDMLQGSTEFGDYKTITGTDFKIPFDQYQTMNGVKVNFRIKDASVNKTIPDTLFQ